MNQSPLRSPIPDSHRPEGGQAAGPGKPRSRVLIADDNEQNLELLVAFLEDLGCEIVTAGDGEQALAAIAASPPDLILLDVMMPRVSGFQVCKRVKADARTRSIPVIMVTALTEVADAERAADSGADAFLSKPVNRADLVGRVRTMLAARGAKV